MASYATINFNYAQSIRKANELAEYAQKLQNIANRDIEDEINKISREWSGKSASEYLKKCYALKNNVLSASKTMRNTSNTIKTIATRTYNAEIRAKQIAERLSQKSK